MPKIIIPKTQTVYKVCRKENGRFYSLHALGYLRHEYIIGKTTRPKPELAKRNLWLYAYDDIDKATNIAYGDYCDEEMMESNNSIVVFECLSDKSSDARFYSGLFESPVTLLEMRGVISEERRPTLMPNFAHTKITPQKIIWRDGEYVSKLHLQK